MIITFIRGLREVSDLSMWNTRFSNHKVSALSASFLNRLAYIYLGSGPGKSPD